MRTSDLQKLGEAYLKVVSPQLEECVDEKDFKPHMMYDPKTGKGTMAKTYADHVKMDKMGYTHEKPEVKEDNSNDKSDDGDGLDKVQPKAVKKKFDNRKDKDIDNDGDVDDSDEFLHKRRKAVSKAMEKEGNAFTGALKAAKDKGEDEFVVAGKKYKVKEVEEDMKTLKTQTEAKKVKEEEEDEDENPVVPARDVKKKEKKKDDEEESDDEGEEEEAPEDDDEEKPVEPKKDKGDMKKNPKTADKKAEISKIESVKTEEAFKSFWQMAEDLLEKSNQKKGATPPEEIDSKMSPKSKEFVAKHGKDEKENDSVSKDNKKAEDGTKPKSGKRPVDSTVGEEKSLVDLAREVLAGNNPNAFAEMKGKEHGKMKKESNPYDGRRKDAKSFLERMAKRRG